jgi:valyl-tRNA synthetase
LVTKIYNAGKFVLSQAGPIGDITDELDRCFIAEIRLLIQRTTTSVEEFEFSRALEVTESFFWSAFTDNYLELVKRRARTAENSNGQASAIATLRIALSTLLRLFAPFIPTITEEVWSWAFADETGRLSIHTASWPTVAELARVAEPAGRGCFAIACDAITAVRKAKVDAGVGLGRPLVSLRLTGGTEDVAHLRAVLPDVANAANASSVLLEVATTLDTGIRFAAEVEAQIPE